MCTCTDTQRCDEAHTIRDAYGQAPTFDARLEEASRYTQHLYDAGILAYPTTAAPRWRCAEACAPEAPCQPTAPES